MGNYNQILEEVYTFLDCLSKDIVRDKVTREELLHEVIVQILEKDKETIVDIYHNGGINGYVARILLSNYNFPTSPFNYQRIKHKNNVVSFDNYDNFIEWYTFSYDHRSNRDEYEEQALVIQWMKDSGKFTPIQIGMMKSYFGCEYNLSETVREINEKGKICSRVWFHYELQKIKDQISEEFKIRWKS